jgi:hypothetical protein
MASWELVPSLVTLRNEFNTIAPNRDKASDGSIGDFAHSQSTSDHNIDDGPDQGSTSDEDSDSKPEVHATDVDDDLKEPFTMEDCIQFIIGECRKDNSVGKDKGRLKNVIYNRRIWAASSGWVQKPYSGSNPHDKHAHFSAEYDNQFSQDKSPWGLIDKFGETVSVQNVIDALTSPEGQAALSDGLDKGMQDEKAGNAEESYATMIKHCDEIVKEVKTLVTTTATDLSALGTALQTSLGQINERLTALEEAHVPPTEAR